MTLLQKILRQKVVILGAATTIVGALALLGVDVPPRVVGGVMALLGVVFTLLSAFLTPASEVIAQQKPGEPVKATAKAQAAWGITKDHVVHVNPAKAA